jgi:membrane protease YdiL (CAAX protease family)
MGRGLSLSTWVLLAYGALAALGATLAVAFGGGLFTRPAWLDLTGAEAIGASIVLGVCGAVLAVIVTRALFRRAQWARALHDSLRPIVSGRDDGTLWLMAVASAVGEEVFFRGFLSVTVGVWLSSLAFGVLHQVRGAGRYGWAVSAFAMGLFFAVLYALTGQLVGCIVSHALVNAVNLRYLRDNDLHPKPRKLGGLLGQQS